ncbi:MULTISPECIES: RNHCP domain-containing protein [Clostridia]|uniref:RNHCP domain-containing protein n=1 Tax=Clostridia TaxID=186801 RepID=UPI000EA0FC39|nr:MULTISPECIES: RNHCP domain-containing protein [Clostridia]NBJ71493.1 RNHCP domain-containing protein [Roseburia sp. 1XD42-34]RKI74354.1 RNHCP domain-containing protein [Clostridium sp. 1xD42-85]
MSRKLENTSFQCEKCGAEVVALTNGSYRNHCPYCLYSKHVDNNPGDRLSECKGLMKPIALDYAAKKGYQIIHQCIKCKKTQKNKVAIDTIQADNIIQFVYQLQGK